MTDNSDITLLDTPGHVDFAFQTEEILSVLDYAILVISASDGVTNYTKTLWNLLKRHNVPVFIFVNKMDTVGAVLRPINGVQPFNWVPSKQASFI